MKRNLFSAIFSSKLLRAFLIFVLFFGILNVKTAESKIQIDGVKISNDKKIDLLFEGTDVKKATFVTTGGGGQFGLSSSEWRYSDLTDADLSPKKMSDLDSLVNQYLIEKQNNYREDYKKVIDKYINDINTALSKIDDPYEIKTKGAENISTNPNYMAVQYLLNVIATGSVTILNGNFKSIFDILKSDAGNYVCAEGGGNCAFYAALTRMRRIYIYTELDKLINKKTTVDIDNVSVEIKKVITDIESRVKNGGSTDFGLIQGESALSNVEISKLTADVVDQDGEFTEHFTVPVSDSGNGTPGQIVTNPDGSAQINSSGESASACAPDAGFGKVLFSTECSVVAYLINLLLQGLNEFFGAILKLANNLLDWSVRFGIYEFSNLVDKSEAYEVWRTVILALVTSLLLPVVFYYIIRMLIDNDTDKIQKILPRILFTALFVYFSFSIVGFLIDQANVFSIYIYRSLHSPNETIAYAMKTLIVGTDSKLTAAIEAPSMGSWDSVPAFAIQLLLTGVAIIVFFQAAILIFVRGITLVLCMIFSPVMILPAGINEYIDKYREMVIKYFTNATIMAPIFLFLILIAMKVGAAAGDLVNSTTGDLGVANAPSGFIGAAISGIISIIIFQLAISTAKNLSGEIGAKVSGKISGVVGNMAFGGTSKVMKSAAGGLVNNKRFQGWIEKGGVRGRLASTLKNSVNDSTFDARNSKTFQAATGGTFGRGTRNTVDDDFNQRYLREKKYYNQLNGEAKEKHIGFLRSVGYNRVADKLEGKGGGDDLSLTERLKADKKFDQKFENANKEKNEKKRMDKINKSIDEHFEEKGKGEKYFTEAMKKKENEKFKKDLEKANTETNEEDRKKAILKVVADFEEADKKKQNTNNLGQNGVQNNNPQVQAGNTTQNGATGSNTQGVKPQTSANLTPLRDRLASRQARTGATVGEEKSNLQTRQTLNLSKEAKDREEENKRYMSDLGKRQEEADRLRGEREEAAIQKSIAKQARKLTREGVKEENLPKTFGQALAMSNLRQMAKNPNTTISNVPSQPQTQNTTNNISVINNVEAPKIVETNGGTSYSKATNSNNGEIESSLQELKEMAHNINSTATNNKAQPNVIENIRKPSGENTRPGVQTEKPIRRINPKSERENNLDGNIYTKTG